MNFKEKLQKLIFHSSFKHGQIFPVINFHICIDPSSTNIWMPIYNMRKYNKLHLIKFWKKKNQRSVIYIFFIFFSTEPCQNCYFSHQTLIKFYLLCFKTRKKNKKSTHTYTHFPTFVLQKYHSYSIATWYNDIFLFDCIHLILIFSKICSTTRTDSLLLFLSLTKFTISITSCT